MSSISRRGFLKGFGALLGGFMVEPAAEILVPRRKIWVVGTDLRQYAKPVNFGVIGSDLLFQDIKASRETLALSLVPMQRRMDYTAIVRKAFLVEPLPDAALPYFIGGPEWRSRS